MAALLLNTHLTALLQAEMSRSTRETFSTEAESVEDPFVQNNSLLARAQRALLPASWTKRHEGFQKVGEDELPDAEEGLPRQSSLRSASLAQRALITVP